MTGIIQLIRASLTLIGSLLLAVLLAGCASQPVVSIDQQVEVSQHPAPGGIGGRVETNTGSDGASLAYVA